MTELVYLRDVVTLSLDTERCNGCNTCLDVCPQGVLEPVDGARKVRIGLRDSCMECGACARNCPTEALAVRAGVGCAAALLNAALGRTDAPCCC